MIVKETQWEIRLEWMLFRLHAMGLREEFDYLDTEDRFNIPGGHEMHVWYWKRDGDDRAWFSWAVEKAGEVIGGDTTNDIYPKGRLISKAVNSTRRLLRQQGLRVSNSVEVATKLFEVEADDRPT